MCRDKYVMFFRRHTDLIEPLSLDEAYLDVTENKTGLQTATQVARTIREQIPTELQLTASAGVAPNKFLVEIASDWKKPNGLFVIQPEEVDALMNDAKDIGLDVHEATISATVLDSAGKTHDESILETKTATILQFMHGLRGGLLAAHLFYCPVNDVLIEVDQVGGSAR
jgi:hypothetical protein